MCLRSEQSQSIRHHAGSMADSGVQAPDKHSVASEFLLVTPSYPAKEGIY